MTRLGDGTAVGKHDPRVAALGAVDELNASLGLARAMVDDQGLDDRVAGVQRDLIAIGGILSMAEDAGTALDVVRLERWIDEGDAVLRPLKGFVLPGGCELAARFHVARTVCRRAERAVVAAAGYGQAPASGVAYLNRLSALLFGWARLANRDAGRSDASADEPF